MHGMRLGLLAGAFAAVVWAGVSAQQEMQSRPGPGSGVMNVSVVNHPAVTAAQSGEWRVSIDNVPDVRVANTAKVSVKLPDFVARGRNYLVIWTAGESEKISVREVGEDGWVQVESANPRWVNLREARSIELQ
jgi:hypothetical protein